MGAGAGPIMLAHGHGSGSRRRRRPARPRSQITTMTAHNVTVGQMVNLSGFTPAAYNGEFRVTAVIGQPRISRSR